MSGAKEKTHGGSQPGASHPGGRLALAIGALGVVYGDIGTSPLYALNLLFFGHGGAARLSPQTIYGGISLVLWALGLVVAIKYATFVLRADFDGEGGVFALYGLIDKFKRRGITLMLWMLLLGAGLLIGDGMITPAISVLSAVEGLQVATPLFSKAVIPVTLFLLTGLFAIQYRGTGGLGRLFGPVMVVWFIVLAALGLPFILKRPDILEAFNPLEGARFLVRGGLWSGLMTMGAVVLVLTGGEAMYADMGHFGAHPIRASWFFLVFPALVINYLGQGAFLLAGGSAGAGGILYAMVPKAALISMVVLATFATIIASQALISGAFSLISQAIALGVFPRLTVRHTHQDQAGQVYLSSINWGLFAGCMALVVGFGSSEALGSAYGLAESGVMITTSSAMFIVARRYWKWSRLRAGTLFGFFMLLDAGFLGANSIKLLEGGWVPLSVGVLMFGVMATWRWGRKITYAAYSSRHAMSLDELVQIHRTSAHLIDRTAILMTPMPVHAGAARTSTLLQLVWDRFGVLPKHLIFVQVQHPKAPYVHGDRYQVSVLEKSARGSIIRVVMQFGFMEEPNVERALEAMISHDQIDLSHDRRKWIVHAAHENLLPARSMRWTKRLRLSLFKALRFISRPAYYHYGLGDEVQLAVEILPVHVR